MDFFEQIARLNTDHPFGEHAELIEKILSIKKPRDFEKLKLTEAQCTTIREIVNRNNNITADIVPLLQSIARVRPKQSSSIFI